MRISLIVTTYEWPRALELVLRGLARQSRPPHEVLVTDDGSGAATAQLLRRAARSFPVPLRHLWQPQRGFRAARARNRAIAAARGDYVVLLDGDVVPHRDFVADHARYARPGCFLQGGRVLTDARRSAAMLETGQVDLFPWTRGIDHPSKAWRALWLANLHARPRRDTRTIMSCNMSFHRADLVAMNGFDEAMTGWGWEDKELAARALAFGLSKRQLKHAALAWHLDHPPRGVPGAANPNEAIFRASLAHGRKRCERGIADHLADESPEDLRACA